MIYLDSAATTLQKPAAVARAMARAVGTLASPGRGGHRAAMSAAETAFGCRELAAELMDVSDPERVVFTSNATHGLNVAIRSLVAPGSTVLISGFEHNAVTRALAAIPRVTIKVAAGPLFAPDTFYRLCAEQLTGEVKTVICTHVSNVFGYVLPMDDVAALCAARGVPLIVDASQSAGCLPIRTEAWGASFVAMPGHKGLYGPQGIGLLLCGKHAAPVPLLFGGTGSASIAQQMPGFLPDRLEAGTHNMPGIAGLLEGLKFIKGKGTEHIFAGERRLIRHLSRGLAGVPQVEAFFDRAGLHQAGVLSLRVTGQDCEGVGAALDRAGFAVRAGLHCAPLAHDSVGTTETGTVRVSVSALNTEGEIDAFFGAIRRIVRR